MAKLTLVEAILTYKGPLNRSSSYFAHMINGQWGACTLGGVYAVILNDGREVLLLNDDYTSVSDDDLVRQSLLEWYPELKKLVKHPENKRKETMEDVIMSLNDTYDYSPQQIAEFVREQTEEIQV